MIKDKIAMAFYKKKRREQEARYISLGEPAFYFFGGAGGGGSGGGYSDIAARNCMLAMREELIIHLRKQNEKKDKIINDLNAELIRLNIENREIRKIFWSHRTQ